MVNKVTFVGFRGGDRSPMDTPLVWPWLQWSAQSVYFSQAILFYAWVESSWFETSFF